MTDDSVVEPAKVKFLKEQIRLGDYFLDAGASRGYFTALALEHVGDSGKVIAFEPERLNYNYLMIRFLSQPQVSIYNYALGSRNVVADLYLGETAGMHTLIPDLPGRTKEVQEVSVVKLDLMPMIGLNGMKIDVEGAELDVLAGAEKTLKSSSLRYIAMDVHPSLGVDVDAVAKVLTGNDFVITSFLEERNEIFAVRE